MAIQIQIQEQEVEVGEIPERIPQEVIGPRIAFVGDIPYSREECAAFCRSHYQSLYYLCKDSGIHFNSTLLTNVINFFPDKSIYKQVNKTVHINNDDSRVKCAYKRLHKVLDDFDPDIIIFLGRSTLYSVKGVKCMLDKERGAPFYYATEARNYLALATYHPKELYREFKNKPITILDLKKALHYAKEGYKAPTFNINFLPTYADVIKTLTEYLRHKTKLSVDIETNYAETITSMCLCSSGTKGFTIPFCKPTERYWPEQEEIKIWRLLTKVLETCPLVGHNAVHFDHNHLLQHYGINANFVDDTMLLHWEKEIEWPKSLAFLNSMYGDSPYWKGELGESRSGAKNYVAEYEYCGKDGCITYASGQALAPYKNDHYNFNICSSRFLQYMGLLGAKLDIAARDKRLLDLELEIREKIAEFEELASLKHNDPFKKGSKGFSVRSPAKMIKWLYEDLGLPARYKKEKNSFGETEEKETSDYLSILWLGHLFPEHPEILLAGKIRKLLKRYSALNSIDYRTGGIVGWSFSIVGTDTARLSARKPNDKKGVQPQNVSSKDRDLYYPSYDDHYFCKADLEGADAWTVAAILAHLGHSRMLEDLQLGLKPAQRVALATMFDNSYMEWPASKLLKLKNKLKIPEGKKIYNTSKAISHGTSYWMQIPTMQESVFKRSEGELLPSKEDCKKQQDLLLNYYNIEAFHEHIREIMYYKPIIKTQFGVTRHFWDRPSNALARTMMAFEPQANTTFVTNTVTNKIFYSDENIGPDGDLIFKPTNTVHDELDGIFPKDQLDKTREIFYSAKDVKLHYRDVEFIIPFDAEYGDHWGNCNKPL